MSEAKTWRDGHAGTRLLGQPNEPHAAVWPDGRWCAYDASGSYVASGRAVGEDLAACSVVGEIGPCYGAAIVDWLDRARNTTVADRLVVVDEGQPA
jgi:hypothetical protein